MRKKLLHIFHFSLSSKATLVLMTEILLGGVIILTSTFLLADLTKDTLFDNEILQFDTSLSEYIYSFRTPELTTFMIFISWLGADFILAVSAIILIFFTWKKHQEESKVFSVMLLFGALLNLLLKEIFRRPRPSFDPLITLTSYSFPSGHAMNSFVFYATVSYFFYHFTKNVKLSLVVVALSILLIALIGISRVYLGVHYPSDVIAGYLAGLLWFALVLALERTVMFFRLYKKYGLSDAKKMI